MISERTFWSGADLNSMYQRVSAISYSMGMEKSSRPVLVNLSSCVVRVGWSCPT